MAVYAEAKDLIDIGAYKSGSNALTDQAIALHHPILRFYSKKWMSGSHLNKRFLNWRICSVKKR